MPLSMDLRERIVAARAAGEFGGEVAQRFDVGIASVRRLDAKVKRSETLEPGVSSGRKPRLDEDHLAVLTALVLEKPDRTILEFIAEMKAQLSLAPSQRQGQEGLIVRDDHGAAVGAQSEGCA